MSWWRRVQQAFKNPSSMKKTASQNVSFVQKKYSDATKDKRTEELKSLLKKSASDYGKRARDVPASLRQRSEELGKQAQERAGELASNLSKRATEGAKELPSKAAEAAKQVAIGAAAAGTKAARGAASAGTRAAADAGRRASNKAWDAMPKIGSYATWTGRRIVYLVFGTAFVYGVGSSLPGAVARYYTERDRRRDAEARRIAEGEEGLDDRPGDRGVS